MLRNCTDALWPRKKTRSGKIFGVMSAALRAAAFDSGGGLEEIGVCRCRREKLRSKMDRKTKNRAKRFMETPFRMRESYNIVERPRKKRRRRAVRDNAATEETINRVKWMRTMVWYLTRAPAGFHKLEDKHAGSATFREDVFGNRSRRNALSGRVMGASSSAGREEDHQGND